jgi:hypothetical protein
MKELIHFTRSESPVCKEMETIINRFIDDNPDTHYTKINVDNEKRLYEFYSKKYDISICPAFIGLVDGKVQDGHLGFASLLVLESLVN